MYYYGEVDKKNRLLNEKTVETIALLQKSNWKSKPDTYVKLNLNMEDYYRIMNQEKQFQFYILKK